jgi:glycosyltransferase involved in cell wall biosynthesis
MMMMDLVTRPLGSDPPLVSIVIPTRNEGDDIGKTLEACLALRYPRKEIVVVDDSSDQTREIVRTYMGQGVRLIAREHNEDGCCGARNLGMRLARGEVVVLLNADDRPYSDFLDRIVPHFRGGAAFVVVQSVVANADQMWGRYLLSRERESAAHHHSPHWSEGFSVLRSAAATVGYIPGGFPLPFCRDNFFAPALQRGGFEKKVDLGIEMPHVVPSSLSSFWRNRVWRGTMSPCHNYYLFGRSLGVVALRELLKAARTAFLTLSIVPRVSQAVGHRRYLDSSLSTLPGLLAAAMVDSLAESVGNLVGVWRIISWRLRGGRRRASIATEDLPGAHAAD